MTAEETQSTMISVARLALGATAVANDILSGSEHQSPAQVERFLALALQTSLQEIDADPGEAEMRVQLLAALGRYLETVT